MHAKQIKIIVTSQINMVFEVYDRQFGQAGRGIESNYNLMGSICASEVPEDNGWLTWLRKKLVGKDKEIILNEVDYSGAQEVLSANEQTIDPTFYSRLHGLIVEYDEQKQGRNPWLFQGSNNFDKDSLYDHRYLITALLMRKINNIFKMHDINDRITQLQNVQAFIEEIKRKNSLVTSSSNDLSTKSLITLLNEIDSEIKNIINKNQKIILRTQTLQLNLDRLSLPNQLDQINEYLIKCFSTGAKQQNLPPRFIETLAAQPEFATLDAKEFSRRTSPQCDVPKDYLKLNANYQTQLLESPSYFEFVQKFFLKPAQVSSLLKQYHETEDTHLKGLIVGKINEYTANVSGKDLVAYGIYGGITDPSLSLEARFESLKPNEKTALCIAASLFNQRNELTKVSYYISYIKDIVHQAGNLTKFFAKEELGFIIGQLQNSLKKIKVNIEEYDETLLTSFIDLKPILMAKGIKDDNHRNRNHLALQNKLEEMIVCVNNIQAAIQPSSMQLDLAHLKSSLNILTEGAINILGMPQNKAENKVVSQEIFKRLELNLALEKEASEKQQQSLAKGFVLIEDEAKAAKSQLAKLTKEVATLKVKNTDLQETVASYETYLKVTKPVIDAIIQVQVDANAKGYQKSAKDMTDSLFVKLAEGDLTLEAIPAYQNLTIVVGNLQRSFQRLKDYETAYKSYVQKHPFSFFHGSSGVKRADQHLASWLTKQNDFMIQFYDKIKNAEATVDGLTQVTLNQTYNNLMEQIIRSVNQEINSLSGGGLRRHSYKTYLLAYKLDLENHLNPRGPADRQVQPLDFDPELKSYRNLEDENVTKDLKVAYRASGIAVR